MYLHSKGKDEGGEEEKGADRDPNSNIDEEQKVDVITVSLGEEGATRKSKRKKKDIWSSQKYEDFTPS